MRSRGTSSALRLAGVASLLSVLSCATGDTANDRVNPENPLWYHRPSGAMQLVVHRKLTAEPRKVGEDYERGRAEIDPEHGRVFVGSADHGLYALRSGPFRSHTRSVG